MILKKLRVFAGHGKPAKYLAFSSDDKLLLAAGKNKTVRIWRIPTGEQLQTGKFDWGVFTDILSAQFTQSGLRMVVSSLNGVAICDVIENKTLGSFKPRGIRNFYAAAIAPDGQQVALGDGLGRIVLIDLLGQKRQRVLDPHKVTGKVLFLAYSPDQRFLLSAGADPLNPFPMLWDLQSGALLHFFRRKPPRNWLMRLFPDVSVMVLGFSFSADSRKAVVGYGTGGYAIWNLENGEKLTDVEFDPIISDIGSIALRSIKFTPDSNSMIYSDGRAIRISAISETKTFSQFEAHDQPIVCFSFSCTHRYLATADKGGHVVLWQVQTDGRPDKLAVASIAVEATATTESKEAIIAAMRAEEDHLCSRGAEFDATIHTFIQHMRHSDPDVRLEARRLLTRWPAALAHLSDTFRTTNDRHLASAIGRVYGSIFSEPLVPADICTRMYGVPMSLIECVCPHCGKSNRGIAAPPRGESVAYLGQKEDKGATVVPVLCDSCGKDFFVAWDVKLI